MPRPRREKGAAAPEKASTGLGIPMGVAGAGSTGKMLQKAAAMAASSGVVPMGAAGAGSTGEMLQKKAAAAGSTGEMLEKKAAAAPASGRAPTMDPGKGPSGSGSNGEMLQKKAAAAASSGGAPTMDLGKRPSGSDSSGEMLEKKAAAAPAGRGARTMDPGKRPSGSNSSGEMLEKKAAAAPAGRGARTMDPGKGPFGSDSSGEMLEKKAAAAPAGRGARTMDPGKRPSGSDSSGEMLQTAAALSGGAPTMEPRKGLSRSDSPGGMLQKKSAAAASSGGSAALDALHRNSTAKDCEESDAKHPTKKPRKISSAKIPHESCTEDEGNMGLSGGVLQKQNRKVEAGTSVNGDMLLHEHPAEEADTVKDIKESVSNEIVHVKEEDIREQEAKRLIKEMNASCIGEQISDDEFVGYYHRLPRYRSRIDLDDKLEDTDMDKQEFVHALYRFRYLKHQYLHQTSKKKLVDDKLKSLLDRSEADCNQEFFEEEEFFRRFEKDMTLDWFIHPDYEDCSSLTDYQRLVLQNYGGTEYINWSKYHKYLHSYKIEKEYVKYCEELSKKLKWMEDYINTDCLVWNYVSTQGVYQAIKLAATDFHKITLALAYNGYHDCEGSMAYDATWFKEYDDLFFVIWQRVTQKSISFEGALKEVYELNMFPLRQHEMKVALEHEDHMMWMETEYQTCTEAIASGDTEEKARKLISEAVKTLVNKPKSYEQYIRKKIEIASIIGVLTEEEDSEE